MNKKPFENPVWIKIKDWMIQNQIRPGFLQDEYVDNFNVFVKTLTEVERDYLFTELCITSDNNITEDGRRIFERILDFV